MKKPRKAGLPSRSDGETAEPGLNIRDEIFKLTPAEEYPFQIILTTEYEAWINRIADIKTSARITNNVGKMRRGLFGDWKELDGIYEMRLDFGPGYRVYYAKHGKAVVVLLSGGDKKSQRSDIAAAKAVWWRIKDEIDKVRGSSE